MGDQTPKPEAILPGGEKRRSQRVLLVIPVEVNWVESNGKNRQASAKTEIVSAHGALLRMTSPLAVGTEVELRHPITGLTSRARVVSLHTAGQEGQAGVGMELEVPSQVFWGVTIPPVRGPS